MFKSPFPSCVRFANLREEDSTGAMLRTDDAYLRQIGVTAARRREFQLGRLAAQRALDAIGVNAPVRRSIDRSPIWPPGVVGSIAHTAGIAVAAVGLRKEVAGVGLDVEDLTRRIDPAMASLIADTLERRWIDNRSDRFLMLFSAKEAVFKALYPLYGRFVEITAAHLTPVREGFIARLHTRVACNFPVGTEIAVRCDVCHTLVMTSVVVNHQLQEAS